MKQTVEERFLVELRHHLAGWRTKVLRDFGEESFRKELSALESDPIYSKFHLHTPRYVFVRLMGRLSISIGRRLGEIFDKIPRLVAQARYGLTKDQVVPKIGGQLELDICIPFNALSRRDIAFIRTLAADHFGTTLNGLAGLGIEIRYNFNPNDSARLRKDVEMAKQLQNLHLFPIYLVFAENSPRNEAIARLRRAGWTFLIGSSAFAFISQLIGEDLSEILDKTRISAEIKKETEATMQAVFDSFAFKQSAP